jgi:hypothetical protein
VQMLGAEGCVAFCERDLISLTVANKNEITFSSSWEISRPNNRWKSAHDP